MKYISINRLPDFEFHDAKVSLDIFDGSILKINADFLNIHQGTEQNSYDKDMEIAKAIITFEDFELISYEPGRAFQRGDDGELYTTDPCVVFMGDSARSRFLNQLKFGITIYAFAIKEGNTYFIDGIADDPFFTVSFTFKNVIIEWDEYKKEAWYSSK